MDATTLIAFSLVALVAIATPGPTVLLALDRKSTRLNSSHLVISYAVFCLKKKKKLYSRDGGIGPSAAETTQLPPSMCPAPLLVSVTLPAVCGPVLRA